MNSFPDRLNDRLESQRQNKQSSIPYSRPEFNSAGNYDADVEELAMLAQRLQEAPQLQVDPDFARHLETRILARHATLSKKQGAVKQRNWLFPRRMSLTLGVALVSLFLVVTAGTLTVAAQVADAGNPLYGVKQWVQGITKPQPSSAQIQAEANWSKARSQLNALTNYANPAHEAAYQQTLAALDQQINKLAQSIQVLPPGPDKDELSNKLTVLKADTRKALFNILPRLKLSAKLLTTAELGRLGATIPQVDSAMMVVLHPKKQATITVTGEHFQSGARLLIDNQIVTSSDVSQNQDGGMVFIVDWPGKQSPETIGILNPDGTVAQTTVVAFTVTDGNSNASNNSSKNNNGNNNASNKGKNNDNGGQGNANNNGVGNGNNGNGKGKGKGNTLTTPTVTP